LVKPLVLFNFVSEPLYIKILFPSPNELFPDCRFFPHKIGVPSPTPQASVSSQSMHTSSFSLLWNLPLLLMLPWIFPSWRLQLQRLFPYLILIKLFLWSLQTTIIFICECRWSRIFLDKLFSIFLMAHCRVLFLMCFLLTILSLD